MNYEPMVLTPESTPDQKARAILTLLMGVAKGPVEALGIVHGIHRVLLRQLHRTRGQPETDAIENRANEVASAIIETFEKWEADQRKGSN